MTPEKITVARQMYDSHTYTVTQIARTLGVSRGTIYQHLTPRPSSRKPCGKHPDVDGGIPPVDEISMIVAALAAGATAGVSGTATEAVKDGYALLKALIRRRFTGRDSARQALAADETESRVWQTRIGQDLHDSGAAADQQILAAARDLLALADPGQAATLNITVGTSHGAIGEFHGPVSFDQRTQLPPTSPAAE